MIRLFILMIFMICQSCGQHEEKFSAAFVRDNITKTLGETFGAQGRYSVINIDFSEKTGYTTTVYGLKENDNAHFFGLIYRHKTNQWDTIGIYQRERHDLYFTLQDIQHLGRVEDNVKHFESRYNSQFDTVGHHVCCVFIELAHATSKDKVRIEYTIPPNNNKPGAIAAYNEFGQFISMRKQY